MIAELALVAVLMDAPTDETPYILVMWESTGEYPNLWPQTLVTVQDQVTPDLHGLDAELPSCGVVQLDLYNDNQTTRDLIAGGVLYGPGNPPESLAHVVGGDPWLVIDLGECVVVPPVEPPVEVPPVDPPVTDVSPELTATGGPDLLPLAIFGPILIGIGILGRRYWGNPERTSK